MPELLPKAHLYPPFRETDTMSYAMRTGLVGIGAGTFSACMKNAYFSTTGNAWGAFTVYGSTIPIYGIPTQFISILIFRRCLWSVRINESRLLEYPTKN